MITEAVRAELSLLTPDDVCGLLKVEKGWLYKQVRLKRIPVVRVGKYIRFTPEGLRAYLAGEWEAEEKVKAEPAPPRRGRPRKS